MPSTPRLFEEREEADHFCRVGPFVDGGVCPHAEPFLFRGFQALDGRIERPRSSADAVVRLFHAVDVEAERQSRMGRIRVDKRAGEKSVRAKVDMSFQTDQPRKQLLQVSVKEGLPARDGDHRGV